MTRREAVAIMGLASSSLAFKSCKEEQNQLALLTQVMGNAMAQLIDIVGNPTMAERLRASTALIVSLLNAWEPGKDAAEIIRQLNEMLAMIQGIPGLDKFRPLVTFVLGTIASIIQILHGAPHTNIRITQPPHTAQEFKADWDAIRAGSQNMEQAPIL